MNALNLVTIVTLLGGAAWTLPPLIRGRLRDPVRLHLCLALLLMGMGNVLAEPSVLALVDGWTISGFSKITYNAAILVGLSLMVGFLREAPLRREAPWSWELVACLVCLTAMILMTVLLPPQLRDHSLTSVYLTDWRVRVFYNFGNFYLLFGYAASAYLAAQHAQRGPSLRRFSLGLICVGLAGLAASCVFRFLWVNLPSMRAPGQLVTYKYDFVFGQIDAIVVCAGLSVSYFASLAQIGREWVDHRKRFRDLEELWERLVEDQPELVLDQHDGWLGPFRTHTSAVYRRYVECRDGLTMLGPYVRLAADDAHIQLPCVEPESAAHLINLALRLRRDMEAQETEPLTTPVLAFSPRRRGPLDGGKGRGGGRGADHAGDFGYEEDLAGLIRVSGALRAVRNDWLGISS